MPAEDVTVSAEFQKFAAEQVESGRYADAHEVLEAAKAALTRRRCYEEKLAYLREAIQEGVDSGVAEGDVFARVRERVGLPPRARA